MVQALQCLLLRGIAGGVQCACCGAKLLLLYTVFRFSFYLHGCCCLCETTGDVQAPALSRISKLPEMAEAAWASTRVMMGRENPKEHTNKTHRHDTGGGTACNDRGDMLP